LIEVNNATDDVKDDALAIIQTPSAVNQQPWSFSVVRDKALLSREALRDKDNSLGPGIPLIMARSIAHRPI
jgi:hypothetical protein